MKTLFISIASLFFLNISVVGQNTQSNLYQYDTEAEFKEQKKTEITSPYALFGDDTKTITTEHQKNLDHTLKIPMIEENTQVALFEINMQTGLASIKNNTGEVLVSKILSNDEKARFTSMDPLAEKHYSVSPYSYCYNNPLRIIDPTGCDTTYATTKGKVQENHPGGEDIIITTNRLPEVIVNGPPAGFKIVGDFIYFEKGGSTYSYPISGNAHEARVVGEKGLEIVSPEFDILTVAIGLVSNTAGKIALKSIDDIMANPKLLDGKSLNQVKSIVGETNGWVNGTLNQGRSKGEGWMLREMNSKGTDYTGRMIQYHPGSSRHYSGSPYWKASSGTGGTIRYPAKK